MRPLKDLIFEEYWEIAYRTYTEEDTIVNADKQYLFNTLKSNYRYWYADPFLFKKDGHTFLFVEMFDNKTEKGIIGYSEFIDNRFTEPQPVLEENFHLSYPYVFEKDGTIYMMPETHEDNCIQLYKAVKFPTKWKKDCVLVENINTVDTIIENQMIITSVVCPENDMSIDLCIFDKDYSPCFYNPVYSKSFTKRGAGSCFSHKGNRIRPSQSCENKQYGCKLYFNRIEQCDSHNYQESKTGEITHQNINTDKKSTPIGIHTYARTGDLETVDIKFKRFNLMRLLWILKNKLLKNMQ